MSKQKKQTVFETKIRKNSLPGRRDSRSLLELILQQAKAGLRAEASRGYLGVLWWVIEPLLYMSVFYFVFAHIMHRGDESYILFLLIGLIVWKWFAASISTGANSLVANVGLMNQVYIPKIVFPLTTVSINTFKFIVILIIFIILLQFSQYKISFAWMFLPALVLLQCTLIVALVAFLSAVMPFFPDLKFILDNLLMMLLFLSGIFFDISKMPQSIERYMMLNPMALLINMYRNLFFKSVLPKYGQVIYVLLFSVSFLLLAIILLKRFDRVYPKIIH